MDTLQVHFHQAGSDTRGMLITQPLWKVSRNPSISLTSC